MQTSSSHLAAPPRFSIIIATMNSGETLEDCLESIRQQEFRSFEVVVIDGGSTDRTLPIIDSFRDIVASTVSEPDHGIYDAWNKAIALAKGEWFSFLGSDDYLWDARVLGDYAEFLDQNSTCRYVYGEVASVGADGKILGIRGTPWEEARKTIAHGMSVPHVGAMHHRTLFDDSRFDSSYRIAADYKLLRPELLTRGACFFPRRVAVARVGGISTNLAFAMTSVRELGRIMGEQGSRPPVWYIQYLKTLASVAVRRLARRLARGRGAAR